MGSKHFFQKINRMLLQDDFAEFVLALLLEETKWTALFAKSGDILEKLANEALQNIFIRHQ